jgi:hypothetical protein
LPPAPPPALGYNDVIDSINKLVSAICDEISALICYPKASGLSTPGNSLILFS